MSKFTFFTILFSLTVIVIVSYLVLSDAIFPQEYKTALLPGGQQIVRTYNDEAVPEEESIEESGKEAASVPEKVISGEEIPVFNTAPGFGSELEPEPEPLQQTPPGFITGTFLKPSLLQQVGFLDISPKLFSGKVFDLFDIRQKTTLSIAVFEAKEEGNGVAVFTELQMPDEISAQELYTLIQNKSKVYVDLTVNETNQYGDRSFYLNHLRKQDEAFLVIRMRNSLYTIAYLKEYHPRIKILIGLLYAGILDQR